MSNPTGILEAAEHGDRAFFDSYKPPESMRAVHVRRSDVGELVQRPVSERDPLRTLHVGEVPLPKPGAGEVLLAVMASSINYNTVWSAKLDPISTFQLLERRTNPEDFRRRHALDYQVIGSDAAGIVIAAPPDSAFRPGDEVVVWPGMHARWSCGMMDIPHSDDILAWGYETNFGGLADFALVRSDMLMPKPAHLTWEEAGCITLASMTAYRMLVGSFGGRVRLGDVVLIWGAAGGIGSYAIQYTLRSGGIPVAVVSSPERERMVRRWGAEAVIDRSARGFRFVNDSGQPDWKGCHRLQMRIRNLVGTDPEIVFEHPGAQTFPASVYVVKTEGKVVTCGSTTGYNHLYDNRSLWLHHKKVIGCHGASYLEAARANQLVAKGVIHPTLAKVCRRLAEVPQAVAALSATDSIGKVGVLCLAPRTGLGVRDPDLRQRLLPELRRYSPWLDENGSAPCPGHATASSSASEAATENTRGGVAG